ncbi:MAG: ECF transporter S component [Candidatus Izemoplasmataceae bacterium]
MRNDKVSEMTFLAMFIAIITVMSFVPWLGYITIGGVAITLIHIPVLIGAIFGGKRVGIVLATTFGVLSMIRAFMTPDAFNVFFQNPLVSVLPRFIFGVMIWYIYIGLHRLLKPIIVTEDEDEEKKKKLIRLNEFTVLGITFAVSSMAHTLITLTALYIFSFESEVYLLYFADANVLRFIWFILLSNGFVEVGLAVIIGAPITWRLREYLRSDFNTIE